MRNKRATTKLTPAFLIHPIFTQRTLQISLAAFLIAALLLPALWSVAATGENLHRSDLRAGIKLGQTPALPTVTADDDHDGIDDSLEQSLAETYAPVIYMEPGEPNYPVNVDWFLHQATLRHDEDCLPDADETVPNAPNPIENQTNLIGAPWVHPDSWGPGHPFAHCDESNHQHGRISTIVPDPDGEGVTGYSDQSTFYLDDLPDEFHVGSLDPRDWVTYFHAYPTAEGGMMIQYWHVYAYNEFGDGFDNHGGDWDASIQVQLDSNLMLKGIWFSRHNDDHPGTFMPYDQAHPGLLSFYQSTHPVMTVDRGGHAAFASAGDWCHDTHESLGARTGTIVWSDDPASLADPGQLRQVLFDPLHLCELSAPVGGTIWQTWTGGMVSQSGSVSHHLSPNNPSTHGGLINLGEYNPCNNSGNCEGAQQASGLLAGQFLPLNNQTFIRYSGRWGHTSILASDGPRNPVFQGFHDGVYTSWYNQATPADLSNGRIAFNSTGQDRPAPGGAASHIYVMNANATYFARLTDNSVGASDPNFTIGGNKIAFTNIFDAELYTIDTDGTHLTRLTNNGFLDAYPSFSPDGTTIAFTSIGFMSDTDIWVMPGLNGAPRTDITNHALPDYDPAFSPIANPKPIAFTSERDGNLEIYVAAADGSVQTRLTNNPAVDVDPVFSSDGKIAFTSYRDGHGEIYVMNVDGSNQTRLTFTPSPHNVEGAFSPTFSPDAKKIAFVSNPDALTFGIYLMNADGSNQTNTNQKAFPAPTFTSPSYNFHELRLSWATGTVKTFHIDDVTHLEGNSGSTAYTFTVTRGGSTQDTATVNFATADGTATAANNDYQPASGTLTFLSGEWSKQITILVNGDTNAEPNEAFFVNLSAPSNASIDRGQGVATILDDDSAPNTPVGNNIKVQSSDSSVNFAAVSQAGTTTFTPIAPASAGTLPGGFTLCSTCPAFDITTSAVYSPPVAICLDVPANVSQQVFATLKLMHGENGVLMDRTTGHFTDSNAARWVCGNVQSLSPFALAQGSSPTASNGEVSGRIIDPNGNPVEGAVVRLSGTQSSETITDASGNYQFDNVETSGFYTVTPSRANFGFSPASRSFSQVGNHTEAAFTGMFGGDTRNPLDTSEYFVRQQYLDFLDREPDQGGFEYWGDQISQCSGDGDCIRARRVDVSAAFFGAQEFQETGSFIHALYVSALGRKPLFAEYSSDRRQVAGGATLETEKQSFAESLVQRAEFSEMYPAGMTGESFVNAVLETVQRSSGVDLSGERDNLTIRYNSGNGMIQSRGLVLRDIADNPAFRQAEYNAAFVLMEYFGYLRRNPDRGGYDFWLNLLNNREPNNYRVMVCTFLTSAEYQQRFSSMIEHTNAECSP